jgi:hypothetical protein
MRNHFNSLNGQLADLRKENSLLRTEIQKLTDKLSQKELLQNKSQDLPLSNVLSYADTIKRCASVVVMPKESSQAVSKTKSDIINKIDPSKSNVDISGVRSTKNGGLILKCHDPSEFKKFALDNKLLDSYEIKDLKTISPRLRISGVSSDLGKEHIISFLVKQNSSVFSNPSQLKILKYFPTKKKPDVFQFILQVDVNTYIKALNSKHCLIGLDNCYIFDAIDVIPCYRCNGYHHSHTFCKRNLSCPRCGESHEVKECKSTVLRCINCVSLNGRSNCRSNGLPLNRDKCYILSFSRKTKPLMFDYRIGNALLTRCFTFKDLGVTFDAQFTFNEHVDIIVASSVKTLGFIFRSCKRFRSESCLRALYFTLVRSKLKYCSIVWSPIYRRGVDALESVQRKFAKYILFKLIAEFPPRGTPNSVLYDMANLRSLNMRRNDSFLIFLYKIIHGIINSPFLLSQIYFNVPRANLRSGRFFYVPRAVTNILHRSPLYTACTLFNSNCSECDIFVISLGQFKRLITCISEV